MTLGDTIKGMVGLDPTGHADPDMKAVLGALKSLNPKPIEDCSVDEARRQPTPADAVKKLVADPAFSARPSPELEAVRTEEIVIPGAIGSNPARVYRPQGEGPFPLILYFHGGGWVIADLDTYDATPRSIAAQSNAIVVSAHYRQAPEHRLPAAHDDAFAAWRWLVENGASLGGDPDRIAVMGESAGGNLAINVSIRARETGTRMPLHQALIYPVASNNIVSVSYEENRNARPLSKPMMLWFVHNVINSESDLTSPLIDVVSADLSGLPPTAIVTAGIDPLRSDGEKLAQKLRSAGVAVEHRNYRGATHEFFGMAAVVLAARDAQTFVSLAQRQAFGGVPLEGA
ncbi:Acetyl esterase/lipase [Paraburkholderia fungorum]|uniref:Acetyl esterase/lipase n=1 Tax=Paraburkholderia fungorum TaxID=134537 RepID=A0A1H1HZ57_9BURK|nr:alpha/beta hydrolase [Paraburkholderia fungorum]SDR30735.1 Acetyl esterase/lipase [Paraburkholderia fungorum]